MVAYIFESVVWLVAVVDGAHVGFDDAVGADGIIEADMGTINNRYKPDDALEDVRDQVLAGAALRIITMPDYGLVMHGQVTNRD